MIEKVRVHEIAKELGIASKDVLDKAKKMGIEVKSAQSVVTMEQAEGLANYIMNGESNEPAAPAKPTIKKAPSKITSDTPKEEAPVKEEKSEEIKVETPKEEVAKEETPVAAEKEVTPVEEKVVETPKKKDATAGLRVVEPKPAHLIKRSGLKIVKKKKPKVVENYNLPQKQASVSSYGKMSAEVLEELAQKKKSKQSSSTARKQDQGKRIDIFGGAMSDVSMDMDDQVSST